MRLLAYVLPVLPGKEGEVQSFARELASRSTEHDAHQRQLGVIRETVFLQRAPRGDQMITYREFDRAPAVQPRSQGAFDFWLKDRLSALHGFDPATAPPPEVELLVRQRPPRPGRLYAATLSLLSNKTERLHEWAMELNGIHAAEFEESLHRLGIGLALFVQYTPPSNLVTAVAEGDQPASSLGELAASPHPFDRWQIQQIADQTQVNFSDAAPPLNDQLWSWAAAGAPIRVEGRS